MKNKVLKSAIIIMLIIVMTMADFILVGMNLVTYAFENVTNNTSNENVKFAAYFKTEEGTSSSIKYEINNNEMKLHLEIAVENTGSLENGKITLSENSNFKIKQEQSSLSKYINSIKGNTITLNSLKGENKIDIELDIEPVVKEEYNVGMLSKETTIKLVGDYKESTEETKTSIEAEKKVTLNLLAPNNLSTTLNGNVITNTVCKIGEETKRIVQLELNSTVVDNVYPIKSSIFSVNLPNGVEEIKVITKGTYATSGIAEREITDFNWNKTNNLLNITIENIEKDGKISWKKESSDNVIITLLLPEEAQISSDTYSAKATVELQGTAGKKEANINYSLAEEKDSIVEVAIENKENIYKGKIYSKEDREVNSTTNIFVNYANIAEEIVVNEETSYDTMSANIQYKTTTISKTELQKILGNEGILNIKDEEGNLIKQITQETLTETQEEDIVVEYSSGIKKIQIEITKAVATGIIRLNHTKVIKQENYSESQIQKIEYLVEKAILKYNLVSKSEKSEDTTETKTNLHNVISEAKLTIGQKTILADQNNELPVTITLKTDEEKYKLFNNPTFEIIMPEGVTVSSASNGEISATSEGLTISKLETDNARKIRVQISGKQENYITSNINTQINFVANVSIEKMMANRVDKIEMTYTNGGEAGNSQHEELELKASNSKIVTHLKLENYNGEGAIVERYSDSEEEIIREIPLEKAETIKVPVTYTIINNYNSAISITPKIIATLIDKNEENKEVMNYSDSEISIEAGNIQEFKAVLEIPAGLYYSEKINVKAIAEYTYSGTQYSKINNIVLATEEKEGIRDISIIDNKLKVEVFAQNGNNTGIKADDSVYNEQVIEYIIEVTNLTGKEISNILITNTQDNGKIYDIRPVVVTNRVEEFEQHEYAELETNTITFDSIKSLGKWESTQLICRVVAKKTAESDITSANIKISADGLAEQTLAKISNKVVDADLKITTKNALKEEVQMYADDTLYVLTKIENLTDKKQENVKVKIYLTEGLTYTSDYSIEAMDIEEEPLDILNGIIYNEEESFVEFNITKLDKKQKINILSYLYIKALPLEKMSSDETIYVTANNIVSNSAKINIAQAETKLSIVQTTNIKEGHELKNGDLAIITAEVSNIGHLVTTATIEDNLPKGLEVRKVELIKGNQVTDKTEDAGKDYISTTAEIDAGETIKLKIEVVVNSSKIVTEEITNKISANPGKGVKVTSNEVTLKIEENNTTESETPQEPEIENPENKDPEIQKPENPDKPIEPGKPEDPEKPTDPEQPTDPEDPAEPEEPKYNISGKVWIDKNKNEQQDANEGIEDVIVKIIDLNNKNTFLRDIDGKEIEVKTDASGTYTIESLSKGTYNIIFKYDTGLYELEENTDIKDYIIESTSEKVAITSNISLEENKTIDLKLKELDKFDLKIDKYITKVITQTTNETKTVGYVDKQLVRDEIQKKYLSGATVLVEYTMQVSNVGELAGYATEIVDYIPTDMKFHSELNTQWYIGDDGNIYNTSLASESIVPGQTKTIRLVLIKTMTKENTGTTSNTAKISQTMNSKEYADINLENNQSKADIIINPVTGTALTYIIAILNAVIIVVVGMYMINKRIVRKGRR